MDDFSFFASFSHTQILELASESIDHRFQTCGYIFRHFRIDDHVHITRFSFTRASLSWYFIFCSWFCPCFYLQSEVFAIDSTDIDGGIIEKVEKWYLDRLCDIERYLLFFWFIFWLISLSGSPASSHSWEDISEIEIKSSSLSPSSSELRKYILETSKSSISTWRSVLSWTKWVTSSTHSSEWTSFRRAELIIVFLFFFVSEDLIRFVDFFELCLCFFVALISIWMILHCELFVCFFYLCFSRSLRDSECRVVVVFCHMFHISYPHILSKK